MEWSTIIIVCLIITLVLLLGILLACVLNGQRCTVSVQQRQPNQELTKMKQEEQEKERKKFSSKMKRAFHSSSNVDQPIEPVQDVKTIELTFDLGSKETTTTATTTNEKLDDPLQKKRLTQKEIDERTKRREEIRRKYQL